jgi:hypothetical protein
LHHGLLALLQDAYLVAPLERFSTRAHRQGAAPPKLVTLTRMARKSVSSDQIHEFTPDRETQIRYSAELYTVHSVFDLSLIRNKRIPKRE